MGLRGAESEFRDKWALLCNISFVIPGLNLNLLIVRNRNLISVYSTMLDINRCPSKRLIVCCDGTSILYLVELVGY